MKFSGTILNVSDYSRLPPKTTCCIDALLLPNVPECGKCIGTISFSHFCTISSKEQLKSAILNEWNKINPEVIKNSTIHGKQVKCSFKIKRQSIKIIKINFNLSFCHYFAIILRVRLLLTDYFSSATI